MAKVLHCKACGARLSAALVLRSGKDPAVTAPVFRDREPLTESGIVFKSYEPIMRSYGGERKPLDFTPQHWLNPADLTDAVRMTKNRQRWGGCCGIAGIDGPNQICRCGAEVGTLQDDCFTSRVFIPEPDATSWMNEP